MLSHLCQEIVAASRQSFVSVTLKRAGCKGDNNDGALEQPLVAQPVVLLRLFRSASVLSEPGVRRLAASTAEDADAVHTLQSSDLFCRLQTVHHGQLDVHEHQMKATSLPLCHGFLAVHGPLPSHLETLHKGSQNTQIDDVVFNNQHIDWGH
jgi:hypothetical protein